MTDDSDDSNNVVAVDFARDRKPAPAPAPSDESALKLLCFRHMIDQGMVQVRFRTQADGVIVPEALRARPAEALNFSHKFYVADFAYDDKGVRASLSFNGQPAFCDLPWSSVFAVASHATGAHVVFPEALPA